MMFIMIISYYPVLKFSMLFGLLFGISFCVASTTPPRVYIPRSSGNTIPTGSSYSPAQPASKPTYSNNVNNYSPQKSDRDQRYRDTVYRLNNPQVLIRYMTPRVKTAFKIELEKQQSAFQERSAAAREERESSYRDRSGGSGSGESRFSPRSSTDQPREGFFDKFEPPPAFGDASKRPGGGRGGKKESERKGSEGSRPKTATTDRRTKSEDDDEESEEYTESEDYYGDEGNIGLDSVPAAALQNMEAEGYSFEEMQMSLYGEYGIKVSMSALKRRLRDDASEKKSRKKTGKTRRDRQNVRKARQAENRDTGIVLPDESVIQLLKLAELMEIGTGELVKHLMMNKGMMVSMTQNIDIGVAKEVVLAFGKKLASENDNKEEEPEEEEEEEDSPEVEIDGVSVPRLPRPPVVTIMGHVDHGKTTLLDTIRKTKVALGEAGGITQGITAFKVCARGDDYVTFFDTPGHAAFSEMRKRGANLTDIVVLVVAADDGIMEQTKECIAAAKTAGCPIVVAINKIDKEGADVQGVISSLMEYGILVEDFGGDVQCAKLSAKKGTGVDDLLDKVLLQAEIMSLKAPVQCRAAGVVIEARMDRRLGVVATVLVQSGQLRAGDYVLAGASWGRVRRLLSDQGKEEQLAGPSTPVQIIGMTTVPNAGDAFIVTADEEAAKDVAESRYRLARQALGSQSTASIFRQAMGLAQGNADNKEIIKVPIVLKADVSGSVEAVRSAIDALQISDDEAVCKVDIVYAGVGEVSSSDVSIAAAAKAKIIAFNVGSGYVASEDARGSNVEIGYFDVVYTLLDEIEKKVKSTLAPPPPGTLVGRALIKKVFKIGKVGKIAGCEVTEGLIKSESQVRIMRGKRNPVYSGKFSSLKVVKEVVSEVPKGSDCGISFDGYQDFEEGDVIECFVGGKSEEEEED